MTAISSEPGAGSQPGAGPHPEARPGPPSPSGRIQLVGLFGPSGAGKTTLARLLPALWPDRYEQVVTFSTRAPRDDDRGSYRHVPDDEFDRMLRAGEFVASTEIRSTIERRRYGYRQEDVAAAERRDHIVIAPVERRLTLELRAGLSPGALLVIGLRPPGETIEEQLAALRTRLAPRYQGDPPALEERLANALEEDLPLIGAAGSSTSLMDAALETSGSERQTAALLHALIEERTRRPA